MGRADRTPTFLLGALGTFAPIAFMHLSGGWPFVYEPVIILPVPILFIIGTMILLLVKPIKAAEHIWTEESEER